MIADDPDRYTATLAKAARRGRIFIDYVRNDRTASAIASYILRSRARAPVAMPLSWQEVTPKLDPPPFTILTLSEIVASRDDPWAAIGRYRQRLHGDAVRRLAV